MGSRARLDRCRKSRPPLGFDPGTVQPVASRYTHQATRPTHLNNNNGLIQFRKITAAYFGSDADRNLQKYNALIRSTEAGGA